MPILEVKDFRKSFGNVEVLKGIDFTLEKGEVLVIIGSSGSGKTTLLRCLNFLETPNAGIMKVGGETLFDAAEMKKLSDKEIRMRRLHFGLVFQSFNLFPQYPSTQDIRRGTWKNPPPHAAGRGPDCRRHGQTPLRGA